MRLLVSVSDAAEAAAALAGGADLIDAKDPGAGPLGAVAIGTFREIVRAVRGVRPVTAALGDAADAAALREAAAAFAAAGARLVKVGFAGVVDHGHVARLLAAAVQGAAAAGDGGRSGADRPGVIAVAYADHVRAQAPEADDLLRLASGAGARGLLVDTFDKSGPGLRALAGAEVLASWVEAGHRAGLMVALAGRLVAGDLEWIAGTGADVAGVRGAACGGHRTDRVSEDHVRELRLLM